MINIHDPVADKSYFARPDGANGPRERKFEIAIADAQGELAKASTENALFYRAGAAVPAPVPAPLPGAGGERDRRPAGRGAPCKSSAQRGIAHGAVPGRDYRHV